MLASRSILLPAPAASPFLAYLRLELRRAFRNSRYIAFTLVFPGLLYLMYTAVIPTGGSGTIGGLAWSAYFMVSMATYGAMGAALAQSAPIALERRGGWARQLRVTPLPGSAYVLAKVASALLLTLPALLLVVVAGFLVNGVSLGAARAIATILVICIGSAPFAALAVLLGYALDAESAQGGMVLAYFTMALLGGLFAPLDALPPFLATIGRMLPSSHLASLGRSVAAGTVPDLADIAVLVAWTLALAALAGWRYRLDERAGRS